MEAYYFPTSWGYRSLQEHNARHAFQMTYKDLQSKVRVGDLEFEFTFDEALELGLGMLEYYFTWAPKHDNFRPIMTEIEFEVPIPGLEGQAVYRGRIDLIVEVFDDDSNSQGYYIVDHKTAKQFGEALWLYLDDQCGSYAWAISKMLGLEIKGVLYNQLRKKPPDPPKTLKSGMLSVNKQQDTTFELFLKKCRELDQNPNWYREYLRFLKHNPKEFCRRVTTRFTPEALEIVEKRIVMEAREMIKKDIAIYPTPSPMNCNGCRFIGPCMQLQGGMQPSMDNYTHVRT